MPDIKVLAPAGFPAGACPIERVAGFYRFDVPAHHFTRTCSTPGHLLHLVLTGGYILTAGGRRYDIASGDIIHYHEAEEVVWEGDERHVSFYSLVLSAPTLPPLPAERRVFPATPAALCAFEEVARQAQEPPGWRRDALLLAAALALAVEVFPAALAPDLLDSEAGMGWWELESRLRRGGRLRASMKELARLSQQSPAAIARACHKATGLSPMRRLRAARMDLARGLLRYSPLGIGEVAKHLGFQRVHEFTREFTRAQGQAPTEFRLHPGPEG